MNLNQRIFIVKSHQGKKYDEIRENYEGTFGTPRRSNKDYAVKAQVLPRNRTNSKIGLYLLRFMLLRNEEGDPLRNLLKFLIYLLVLCLGFVKRRGKFF